MIHLDAQSLDTVVASEYERRVPKQEHCANKA